MKKLFLLFMMLTTSLVFGQLDPNFFTTNDGTAKGFNGNVSQVLRQGDGKFICIGTFTKYSTTEAAGIIRLNADWTVDTTFEIPTLLRFVNSSYLPATIESVAVQNDGKILLGGNFEYFTSYATPIKQIVRLNADGTRDTTFVAQNFNSGVVNITAITPLSGGKIAIGGTFTTYGGVARVGLAVLNSNGSLDTSFNTDASVFSSNNGIYKIADAGSGKLLVSGNFMKGIARLNANGTVDSTFDVGTGANPTGYTNFAVDGSGRIIVVGGFTSFNGENRNKVARLMSNGMVDPTFVPEGTSFNGNVSSVYANYDNTYFLVGTFTSFNGNTAYSRFAKMNANGTIDGTVANIPSNGTIAGLLPVATNKFLVYGQFTTMSGFNASRMAVVNSNGSKDENYTMPGNGLDAPVNKAVKQADGKLIIAGTFNYFDNVKAIKITRMLANGDLDPSFNSGTGFNGDINNLKMHKDGKILVAGNFSQYNGTAVKHLVRLNPDGSLDTTFNVGTGPNLQVHGLDVDSQNRIYIGGEFTQYNGVNKTRIARLNEDGTLDTTFTGFSAFGTVRVVKVAADGSVFLGTGGSGQAEIIVKLTANGAKAPTSGTGAYTAPKATNGGLNLVTDFTFQPDGKIIAVGTFREVEYSSKPGIVRIATNGLVDGTFNGMGQGFETNAILNSVNVLSNGTVIVGGAFNKFNNVDRYGFVKLSNTGAIDNNFNIGFNINTTIYAGLYDNGFLYLGGTFSLINSEPKTALVKYLIDVPAPSAALIQTLCPNSKLSDIVVSGENIKWYNQLTGGTQLPATTTVSNNTTYYASQTLMGTESPRVGVSVTTAAPAAPTGNAIQYVTATTKLSDLVVNGSNIKWYPTEMDAIMKTNQLAATTTVVFETTYYATQTIGSCESALALAVKVRDQTLAVNEINSLKTMVYPNPAKDIININATAKVNKVSIYSADGRKVSEGMLLNNQYNVSKLSKGIYIIQITTDKGTETVKMIKD